MKTKDTLLAAGILLATLVTGFSQPTLQFSASSYAVAESAGAATLTVRRTGDTNPAVTVDYATMEGTATNGLKYAATNGTLAFAAGETNQVVMVPILNDGFADGTKTFRVLLTNATGGALLGIRTNVPVNITDNDVGIQFQFAAYSVTEDAGAVLIGVVRGDDGTLPITVDITTANLSAVSGVDYTGVTTNLAFASQERFKWVTIPILNNNLKQANKTFRITLSNPMSASLGSQKTTTITIVDNDQGFRFEFSTNNVGEDAGVTLINVLRGTDDTNSAVTVDIATSDLSANSGVDYLGHTNTLAFAPGDKVKQVAVPILNNGLKQATRNFRLTLSNPTAGAVLGSPTITTVSILDNDQGVGFEQNRYTNVWGSGSGITLTVLRGNDWALGPITVDYTTADLTALAGQDYQAIAGKLEFQTNDTIKTLTIPLLHNRATEGTKYFRLTLSNATGGVTLGTSSAILYIVGSYFPVAPPFDTALTIQANGNWNTLSWTGGGMLQRADSPTRPWQSLTSSVSPTTIQSPIPTTFYRVARPRPVNLYIPSSYNNQAPMPLVILLHEYTATGAYVESYMRFQPLAETRGFLYCHPDSLIDRFGNSSWNATDASTGYDFSNGPDDVGFLRGLIEEIGRHFAVDRKRIYVAGHSNGAFMAYRMACESADLIAGIASLAGMTFLNPSNCAPSQPVNILHIHGTADNIVPYAGGALTTTDPVFQFGANMPPHPGALQDVQTWANNNEASGPVTDPAPSLDLTTDIVGLDTVKTRYTNAAPGGAVELWTINGGSHGPTLSAQFSPLVIDWLLAHPKP